MMDSGTKGKGDGQKTEKNTAKQEKKKKEKGNPQTTAQSAGQKGSIYFCLACDYTLNILHVSGDI